MTSKYALTAAAAVFASTSVAAQAAEQPLPSRGSEVAASEEIGGGSFLIPVLAIAAIILGILAMTGSDDEDIPTSP